MKEEQGHQHRPSDTHRHLAISALVLGIAITVLDSSLITVSLPVFAESLDISPATSLWVLNAFQMAVIALLIPLSNLAGVFGYRRIYIAGLLLFMLGAAGCALAPSFGTLLMARIIEGCGAAGVMCVNLALTRLLYPPADLARGIALNSLVVALSSVAGPMLASAIISLASWRGLFILPIPFGVLACVLAVKALPDSEKSDSCFDVASAVLSASCFISFLFAVESLRRGHVSGLTAAALVLSMASLFVLVKRQRHVALPMLPLDLLRSPPFALSIMTSCLSFAAQTIALAAIPFAVIAAANFSLGVTTLLTPWPLAVAATALVVGRLSKVFSGLTISNAGLCLLAAGLFSVAFAVNAASSTYVIGAVVLSGLGFGLFQALNNSIIMSTAPLNRSASASGLQSTARLMGQGLGAALVGVVLGNGSLRQACIALLVAGCLAVLAALLSIQRRRHMN
jgi:MFS transporter, DHA2 family, multidrug resistance protein